MIFERDNEIENNTECFDSTNIKIYTAKCFCILQMKKY